MVRPLRIEFPGAIYHVTSRGDRQERIFVDDDDRMALLSVLGHALHRHGASMLAYCLMGNHYHFVLRTDQGNLSRVMRQINGVYTQAFNARHGMVGHLFQGRFKAILVDRESYLVEVCRYVELNPVRAGIANRPDEWRWSSYLSHIGRAAPPAWLDSGEVLALMLGRAPGDEAGRALARKQYAQLVNEGIGVQLWETSLRQQIYLGDNAFVERMQASIELPRRTAMGIPSTQRNSPRTLEQWLQSSDSLGIALMNAHRKSGLSMTALAKAMGLSVSTVSRRIRAAEADAGLAVHAKRET